MLRQGLEKGLPIPNLMENWDFLQVAGGGKGGGGTRRGLAALRGCGHISHI